ncbi:MAG: twin-arginine translocase TatA/TatE family subunit [Solirubrobacterales bacterium]
MPNIGPLEVLVVLIIALVIFGPKRLPELGRSLGKGIREFRGSISGERDHDEDVDDKVPELEAKSPAKPAEAEAEPVEGEVVADKRA